LGHLEIPWQPVPVFFAQGGQMTEIRRNEKHAHSLQEVTTLLTHTSLTRCQAKDPSETPSIQ